MAQKRNQWKLKGVALIMALYLTVILAALGTFFIADQLNKSRTATDSVDSQLALQGANGALNMIVNYFGNTTYDWYDALTLASGTASPPTAICPGDTAALENGGNPLPYPIEITQVTLNQAVPNANPAMDENQYAFNFINKIPIPNSGGKVLVIPNLAAGHNVINILYYPLTPGAQGTDTVCGNAEGSENAAALQSIQIDIVAEVENSAGAVLATREIQWTGARFSTSALNYPGESSWNGGPGGDPPNYVEGTETDAYIGNGETINGTIFSLADPNTANNSTYGYLTNPSESPYGTDTNGAVSLQDGSSGCNGCPTINPQLNGGVQANGAVSFTNASGTPITGQVNGSESQNTGDAVSSPMGTPWGPATTSSGSPNPNTAPGNMLNAYNQAASNCPGGVQTVFIDASNNIGVGNPGGSGYEVEVPNDYTATDPAVTKPGYAVTDITLNSNNSVTINRYGYYSGAELYSETITPSQLQTLSQSPGGAVLYIQGGNVRVHGNLSSVGLTVAANQGDEFFNSAGQPINSNSTSCVASDNTGSGTVTPTLANAERFNSSLADHAAGNQTNYWIPNACGESGQPGCSPSAFTPSPPTQPCGPCLVDGTYYSSYTPPSGSSGPSGNPVGYAIDNVNGQPNTLNISCSGLNSGCSLSSPANQGQTIFAPPPTYNSSTGKYTGITQPTQIGGQWVFPYPGASAVNDLVNGSAGNGTTWAGTDVTDLFYANQYQESEGNLTISGSVSDPYGLGLMAQNYILLNDFNANNNANNGKYNFNVQADLISANQSVQWEALTQGDATNPQQTFINGDTRAWNGTGYGYPSGANSQEGGLSASSPLFSQPTNANGQQEYWSFNLTGSIYAPYQDVVNTINNNNNNDIGYAEEQVSPGSINQKPPLFPSVGSNFQNWQTGNFLDRYITLSYSDMGAYQAGR